MPIFVNFDSINKLKKCLIDLFKKLLMLSPSYCLLSPKILTLVVQLGFEKKAFEMSSFQSPF